MRDFGSPSPAPPWTPPKLPPGVAVIVVVVISTVVPLRDVTPFWAKARESSRANSASCSGACGSAAPKAAATCSASCIWCSRAIAYARSCEERTGGFGWLALARYVVGRAARFAPLGLAFVAALRDFARDLESSRLDLLFLDLDSLDLASFDLDNLDAQRFFAPLLRGGGAGGWAPRPK
eukprot:scaffold97416_cov22-Tisochrysis_lutea.AAC.2